MNAVSVLALRGLVAALLSTLALTGQVVPRPQSLARDDAVRLAGHRIVCASPSLRPQVDAFVAALARLGAPAVSVARSGAENAVLRFELRDGLAPEAYRITSHETGLSVRAGTPQGAARAAVTLLQLVTIEGEQPVWPGLEIEDRPQHPYRSFMVDMGRNPHGPETLRHVVDMMWFYKGNQLHLHLSDDQLFSWPSRRFPELREKRAGWSWDDFVELEAYAAARGIAIVPEFDVPGHSTLLRRKYPEVFGKTPTELARSPRAQAGVEALIAEALSVFGSSRYVHVGGDEAYGVPAEIQRDFINRLNAFVKSRGRRTLVWEGPRLGRGKNKVDEDVIHINWRTIDFPAQQMLEAGYQVVAAPWDPFYIVDHYPRTMFTAVEVARCYRWNPRRFAHVNHDMPTFAKPQVTSTSRGILGFCMPWWEGRQENLLPLCLSRFAAAASAAWNRRGEQDWDDWRLRHRDALTRLQRISGFRLPSTPFAARSTQRQNLAYRGRVTASSGTTQPHFGPERLTNGITERFDHFLGFPTRPEPLEIVVTLPEPAMLGRIVVHETAVGESHEVYELLVSSDGKDYRRVGNAKKGSRGETSKVTHRFPPCRVAHIKIRTRGCHGLTFPSFSRLTEVEAFAR